MSLHLDRIAGLARDPAFSGVVRVDVHGETVLSIANGFADRGHGIANTMDTRFGMASGSKTFTALVAMSLVDDGVLSLDTPARSLLGEDLPLVDDAVTVEHLLSHTSGIGDYIDEDLPGDVNDHVLAVPVHLLLTTEDYLRVLDGYPQKRAPGTGFSYCNGGYVVLALLCERASGVAFHDLVDRVVVEPAGLTSTAYLRNDELPGDIAIGYLDGPADSLRTNALHLPVRGSGDGGAHTTVADVHRLWAALDAGGVVSSTTWSTMTTPRGESPSGYRYGFGVWLPPSGAVEMEGCDAGVSFRSTHDSSTGVTTTVVSNTSSGAWPIARAFQDLGTPTAP